MSVVHTALPTAAPGHRGEADFARRLVELGDDRVHLWFGVDYLPGVSDLDVLACHTDLGFFAIEVKAVTLDAIEEYGPGQCSIRGRHNHLTPLQQARKAQVKLTEYLRNVGRVQRPPFIHVTAAWPRIARSTFNERWLHPAVQAQAASMLFNEDQLCGEALEERLRHLSTNPAMGAALSRPAAVAPVVLDAMIQALSPGSVSPPSNSERVRISHIEDQLRGVVRAHHTLGQTQPVLFLGAPGTGKTFRLLEIALAHAQAGHAVLFTCYNKVLAADLRRLLHASESFRAVAHLLDVVDIEQLFQRYTEADFDGDYDRSRTLAVTALQRGPAPDATFDTLLVDEAQDLKQWGFELLEWLAGANADWFVAEGRGQSLYDDEASAWLQAYAGRAKKEHLRRVFRTARMDFLVAQVLHELSPATETVDTWLEAKLPRQTADAQLSLELAEEFDRPGQPPHLVNLQADEGHADASWRETRAVVVAEYRRVIQAELQRLESLGSAGDLAILVPGTHARRSEAAWVLDALHELDVPHLDQVDEEQRRNVVPPGHVRLVTYHSARGIEAGRCLVLGMEALQTLGPLNRQRNLGYIALSRARFGTTIAVSPYRTGEHVEFIKAVVGRMAALQPLTDSAPNDEPAVATVGDRLDWRSGAIARLNRERGFGFLTDDATREEVFFHFRCLFGLAPDRLTQGLRLRFSALDGPTGRRATMLAPEPPPWLTHALAGDAVPAVVVEPIGERGFGFLLSPCIDGRIFLHEKQLIGLSRDDLTYGSTLRVVVEPGPDERPRAVQAQAASLCVRLM